MPAPPTFPRGRFVWHELMTTDPDAAVGFYSKVVGWKVRAHVGEQHPSYRLWMMGDAAMGGLMRLPDDARRMGAPPHWMPYVAVPDVDAAVRQAQGTGARLYVPPKDIPEGRFAVLADPQGATFSVYKPAPASTPPPDTDDVKVGGFSWHELVTTDWKRAWDFYRALVGWEHASSMEMGPGNTYWMFKRGGGTTVLGGMYNKSADMPAPPHWLCYVLVPDADRAAETAARAGGKIVMGPMDVPGGDRIAGGLDPQGAAFAVHARAAGAAKAVAKQRKAPAKKRRKAAKAKRRR
jgi:predicted enzyme related to lactoylglutathione lyase